MHLTGGVENMPIRSVLSQFLRVEVYPRSDPVTDRVIVSNHEQVQSCVLNAWSR